MNLQIFIKIKADDLDTLCLTLEEIIDEIRYGNKENEILDKFRDYEYEIIEV